MKFSSLLAISLGLSVLSSGSVAQTIRIQENTVSSSEDSKKSPQVLAKIEEMTDRLKQRQMISASIRSSELAWHKEIGSSYDIEKLSDRLSVLQQVDGFSRCLETSSTRSAFEECTESQLDFPDSCSESLGFSTAAIVRCYSIASDAWEVIMNSVAQALEREYSEDPELVGAFRRYQTVWSEYKESECTFYWTQYRQGTIRSVIVSNCVLSALIDRSLNLISLNSKDGD